MLLLSRPVERWFKALCLFPALATASVYMEALAASLALGHWPIPSLDDPKGLATAPLHLVTFTALLALTPILVIVAGVVLINWKFVRRESVYWRWLALFVAGFVLFLVLGRMDPGQVWYWWMD